MSGPVRDPYPFPPPFSDRPTFYVTLEALASLGLPQGYTELQFAVTDFDQARADALVAALTDR